MDNLNIRIAQGTCRYSPRKTFMPENLYIEYTNRSPDNALVVESIIDLKKTDGQKLHHSSFVADTGEIVNFLVSDSTIKVILADCFGTKTRNGWVLDLLTGSNETCRTLY